MLYPKEKWYLNTWFIALLFVFWPFILPAIGGIIFLVMQHLENKHLAQKYGCLNNLDAELQNKQENITVLEQKQAGLKTNLQQLQKEIDDLSKDAMVTHYNFSDYDAITSEECKNKLALLKMKENELVKSEKAVSFTVSKEGKKKAKLTNDMKQILRTYNAECDNVLLNLSVKNIDSSRNKIQKSYASLNKVFVTDSIELTDEILALKLEELNLIYTYELKKEQEREQQRTIKEQMVEEEKARREIERQKAQIEKDQTQCSNEVKRLMAYLQKTESEVEKQLYADKIRELEEKLKALEKDKATVLDREANAKAGYVYIISNIGSFGEGIYKIGMTRRLEPMDRIQELGSASVPFNFDVHAMIFSEDAPALENALHQKFEKQSVNRVNLRKEFFRVTLDEIEKVVKEKFNNTTEFTRIPVAKEYHETLEILKGEAAS